MTITPVRSGIVLIAAVALAALTLLVPAAQAATPAPAPVKMTRVYADCVHAKVAPRRIMLACGDANSYLTGAVWRTWGLHGARGHGRLWYNDCEPNCAAGSFHHVRAGLQLFRVRHGVFTRLRLTFHHHGHTEHQIEYLLTRPI